MKTLDVRNAMGCESTHGICQVCAGLNEHGESYPLGFNLGALAATTISEPLTQGVMKNFHQGNTAFSKTISGLDRVRQLIELPKMVAGEGPLAADDGEVEDIQKESSGDYRVTIAGKHHFVPSGMMVNVAKGDAVKRGDPVSSGVQNPHEILKTRGIHAARTHIADELHRTYKEGNGLDLDRRHFEVIAKTLSDHAYIEDPGDAQALVRGDYMPLTKVEAYNKLLDKAGQKRIEFTPQLKGAVQSAISTDDWLARTSSRSLSKKLQEAAGFGLSTNVGPEGHPVARYIWGVHVAGQPHDPNVPSNVRGVKLEDLAFHGPIAHQTKEKKLEPPPLK
jgi:DNA-directed RNA polymerase subunit beta'